MGHLHVEDLVTAQLDKSPVIITADANCTSVDLAEFNQVTFIASVGASGDTLSGSVYLELEVEESDNDSDWTDCVDADITNAVTGTTTGTFALINATDEDETVHMTTYKGNKRYVRVVANVTGTHTNGIEVGVVSLKSGSNYPS